MRLHLTRRRLLFVLTFGWLGWLVPRRPTKNPASKFLVQTRLTGPSYHYDARLRTQADAEPPCCIYYVYDAQGLPPRGPQPMDGSAFPSDSDPLTSDF